MHIPLDSVDYIIRDRREKHELPAFQPTRCSDLDSIIKLFDIKLLFFGHEGAMLDDPEPARDPQDLERLLVSRQRAGDVDGMLALYEPNAVLDSGEAQLLRGREAIREFFAAGVAVGRKFASGEQSPAIICGDLALTSTRLPDNSVTVEVARRQHDGTWLWVIDRFSIA